MSKETVDGVSITSIGETVWLRFNGAVKLMTKWEWAQILKAREYNPETFKRFLSSIN